MSEQAATARPFHGWRVVAAAFVLAVFGWGLGVHSLPIYLATVQAERGWSVGLVSAAVTLHYLTGALVIANLPRIYRRFGLPFVTRAGAVLLLLGLVSWASATAPWQLFGAVLLTGAAWVTMGAAAINAIVSPWFVRLRPKALSAAYNGASVGGIIFAPLWVLLIGSIGFQAGAIAIGAVTVAVVWWLSVVAFSRSPADLGQEPDGDAASTAQAVAARTNPVPVRAALSRDWQFRTLAAGMSLGLFAQIGLLAHLFSLIVPVLGASGAGVMMGLATASAIAGRTAFGRLMPANADRRLAAALSHGVQVAGSVALMASGMQSPALIVAGVLLFGFGVGNATSLPPLIAQVEFAKEQTGRVVALVVATAQAVYAFAPAAFGLLREAASAGGLPVHEGSAVFLAAIVGQGLAIAAFLIGRRPRVS